MIQNIGDIKLLGSIIKFCINIKTLYNSPKTKRQLKQNSRTYYFIYITTKRDVTDNAWNLLNTKLVSKRTTTVK